MALTGGEAPLLPRIITSFSTGVTEDRRQASLWALVLQGTQWESHHWRLCDRVLALGLPFPSRSGTEEPEALLTLEDSLKPGLCTPHLIQGICKSSLVHFYCALVYLCSKPVFTEWAQHWLHHWCCRKHPLRQIIERTCDPFHHKICSSSCNSKKVETDLQTLSQVGSL